MTFPFPTVSHPRFPNPISDGFIQNLSEKGRTNIIKMADAWNPTLASNTRTPIACAISYYLTEDTAYIDKLDKWFHSFDMSNRVWPKGYAVKTTGLMTSWLYDFMYNVLEDDKKHFWLRQVVNTGLEAIRIFNQGKYSMLNSVTFNREGAATIACGLAAYPDALQEYGTTLWDTTVFFFEEFNKAWAHTMDGGVWPEGWTYHGNGGETPYMVLSLAASAYNSPVFKNTKFLKDLLKQAVYLVEPDGTTVNHGDQDSNLIIINKAGSWKSFLAFREMAAFTQDQMGLAYVGNSVDTDTFPLYPWSHRITQIAPEFDWSSLPKYLDAKGAGLYHLRDGWYGEDTKMINIYCGGINASHKASRHGDFDLYNKGAIICSARAYAGGAVTKHNLLLGKGSYLHNCLRIYDPADQSHTKSYRVATGLDSNNRPIYQVLPLPKDGGQKRVGSGYVSNMPQYIDQYLEREHQYISGVPLVTQHSSAFDYMVFDLTKSYTTYPGAEPAIGRTDRVDSYLRSFIYLRPNILIISDKFNLTDPSFRVEWPLHTREAPELRPDGVYHLKRTLATEFENGVDRGMRYRTEDGKYQYNGHAFLQRIGLEPTSRRTTDISEWAVCNDELYTGFQQFPYRRMRDWHPTDPTKGPIEVAGYSLVDTYLDNGSTQKHLCYVICMDEHIPAVMQENADGSYIIVFDSIQTNVIVDSQGNVSVTR